MAYLMSHIEKWHSQDLTSLSCIQCRSTDSWTQQMRTPAPTHGQPSPTCRAHNLSWGRWKGQRLGSSVLISQVVTAGFFSSLDELHIPGKWSRSPQRVFSSPQVGYLLHQQGPGQSTLFHSCDHCLA